MIKTFRPHPGYVRKTDPIHHQIARSMVNIDPTDYLANLYSKYGPELVALREKQKTFYRMITAKGHWPMFDDVEGEVLYLLVKELQPMTILEVGPGSGWSTSWALAALQQNAVGTMWSYDIRSNASTENLGDIPQRYVRTADIRDFVAEIPPQLDMLLWDTDHDPPLAKWAFEVLFPRLRTTGIGMVHDVYGHPTPSHGEAIQTFNYLNSRRIHPWSVSNQFPKQWERLKEIRRAAGIDPNDMIHMCPINTALFFWADPERG